MYPHERSLVKRLEGKPFVLLGVNSDGRGVLREAIKKQKMTWRSWWDGGSTGGPIASQWNIQGWPTLYLIDSKGILRNMYVGAPGGTTLDDTLNGLIAEVSQNKAKPAVPQVP